MKLRCMINGVEYNIIQGATFSEEYNETLDSGTIILDHVKKIEDLKPYDDVFIYSNPGSFKGYPLQSRIEDGFLKDKYFLNSEPNAITENNKMNFILGRSFYSARHDHGENIVGYANLKFDLEVASVSINNLYLESLGSGNGYKLKFTINNSNDFSVKFVINLVINPTGTNVSYTISGIVDGLNTINIDDCIIESGGTTASYIFIRGDWEQLTLNFSGNTYIKKDGSNYFGTKIQTLLQVCTCYNFANVIPDNISGTKNSYNCTANLVLDTNSFVLNENSQSDSALYVFICGGFFNNNGQFLIEYSNYQENKEVYANFPYSYSINNPILNIDITYNYDSLDNLQEPYFYKHLLVDQFSEEMINVDKDDVDQYFKYTIQLFSETKKLETIQLPNISVTQPLNYSKKRSIWDYLVSFVDMYSPLFKVASGETWSYEKKYTVSPSLEAIFGDTFSPDFVMNTPNLRDLLSKLMIVKDRIPYVKDDVIYAMDITARNGEFNANGVNFITGSMSSDSYCDNLKRNYSGALSQDNNARLVEYLGFRNSNASLMTLENMRLETRFPIYKINKMYMCYYKRIIVTLNNGESDAENVVLAFLCKQDMTKLVKLNSERNLLSENWEDFSQTDYNADSFSKFKMATVGYDIGSKNIEGWGQKYVYPIQVGYWDTTHSYLQNIFTMLDSSKTFGIESFQSILQKIKDMYPNKSVQIKTYSNGSSISNIVSPFEKECYPSFLRDTEIADAIPETLPLKSFFFQIDYNAFYSGAVIQSKDDSRDDIVIGDNQSSSLTLLEQDGIAQKEKANRFANKTLRLNARYNGDYNNLQPLGSVFSNRSYDDIVIYHREYSIWDNMISAVYYGSKDYVLKNYFTSVFARYRTYNLMSYGESTNRAENKRMLLCFSKDNYNYESENKQFALTNFDNFYSKVLSGLCPIESPYYTGEKINYGYIKFDCPNVLDGSSSSSVEQVLTGGSVATINFNFNITRQQGQNSIFSDFEVTKTSFEVVNLVQGGGGSIQSSNFQMDSNGHVTGVIVFNYGGFNASRLRFYVYYNYKETSYDDNYYGADINVFNSGLSLCFNLKMFDNISSGVYIDRPTPVFGNENDDWQNWWTNVTSLLSQTAAQEQVAGSSQKWLMTVDDKETGFAENMGFYICHTNSDDYFASNKVVTKNEVFNGIDYTTGYYSKILKLPKIDVNYLVKTNVLGNQYKILKDNKECVDMTFEIETYSKDDNVVLSPLLLQLSDLLGNYNRFSSDYPYYFAEAVIQGDYYSLPGTEITVYSTTIGQAIRDTVDHTLFLEYTMPLMILEIPQNMISNLINNRITYMKFSFDYSRFNVNGCCNEENEYGGKIIFNSENPGCKKFCSTAWWQNAAIIGSLQEAQRYKYDESIVGYTFEAQYIKYIETIEENGNNVYVFDIVGNEEIKVAKASFNAKTVTIPQEKTMRFKTVSNLENFNITGTHPGSGNIWLVNLEKRTVSNPMPNGTIKTIDRIYPIAGNSIQYEDGKGIFSSKFPNIIQYRFTNGTKEKVDSIFFKGGQDANDYYSGMTVYDDWFNTYNTISSDDRYKSTIYTGQEFKVYDKNMFVVYNEKFINKTNMYDQFPELSDDYINGYITPNEVVDFSSVFSINDVDEPYIGINVSNAPSNANSIQYWFYDEQSNSYRFVFGVNITDADRNAGFIKVYLSLISTKDERIYDIMHNVIGKNHNYYYEKAGERYGIKQNYDYKDEYFVRFEPNCADYSGTMQSETFTIGVSQALSSCSFTRPYYRFVGWSKKASPEEGDTIDFKDGDIVMFNENVTLYAIWELIT